MFFRRFRKPKYVDMSADEVAEAMLKLATAFTEGSAAEGYMFAWEPADALRLDEACDDFLRSKPKAAVKHSMIMAMGAYLGELLVRHGNGTWGYDTNLRAATVAMPNGLVAYPHNKVAKRLDGRPEHSIRQFYWYAITRNA